MPDITVTITSGPQSASFTIPDDKTDEIQHALDVYANAHILIRAGKLISELQTKEVARTKKGFVFVERQAGETALQYLLRFIRQLSWNAVKAVHYIDSADTRQATIDALPQPDDGLPEDL